MASNLCLAPELLHVFPDSQVFEAHQVIQEHQFLLMLDPLNRVNVILKGTDTLLM